MKTEKEIRIQLTSDQKCREKIGVRIDKEIASSEDYTVDDQLEGAISALEWVLGDIP